MESFITMFQKYVPVVLGFVLGLGAVPALDKAAEYHVYGEDTAYALPVEMCMVVGMSAGPSIHMAKGLGVSKRKYMVRWTESAAKAVAEGEKPRIANQIVWYVGQMWEDNDTPIEMCFERADKANQKPSGLRS